MTKRTKKRNQADATLRNVRAATRRISALEQDVAQLREQLAAILTAKQAQDDAHAIHAATKEPRLLELD